MAEPAAIIIIRGSTAAVPRAEELPAAAGAAAHISGSISLLAPRLLEAVGKRMWWGGAPRRAPAGAARADS